MHNMRYQAKQTRPSETNTDPIDLHSFHPVHRKTRPVMDLRCLKQQTPYCGSIRILILLACISLVSVFSANAQDRLASGGHYRGALDSLGEQDRWSVGLTEDQGIWIRVASNEDLAPLIRLRAPDGSVVASDSDGIVADIFHRAESTGDYLLTIEDDSVLGGLDTGAYEIHVVVTQGEFGVPEGDEGGTLISGGNHEGTITLGDLDMWSMELEQGEILWVRVANAGGDLSPLVVLYGPDGQWLEGDDDGTVATLSHTVTTTGNHTVVVTDEPVLGGDDTGSYVLFVSRSKGEFIVPEGDEGGMLTNGGNHDGKIALGDLDMWNVRLEEGDSVLVRISRTNGDLSPIYRLYDPDGQLLVGDSDSSLTGLGHVVETTGLHTLVVGDDTILGGDDTGSYRIHVAFAPESFVIPEDDEGGSLDRNEPSVGMIELGDLDLWQFWADQGSNLSFRARDTSSDGGLSPWMRLFNPDGRVVAGAVNSTVAEIEYRSLADGYYMLLINDGNNRGNGVGSYEITSMGLPDQTPSLRIRRPQTDQIVLHWASTSPRQLLEETWGFSAAEWIPSELEQDNNGFNVRVMVPVDKSSHYFRLHPLDNDATP
jgi:hypothetical protein